MTELYIGNKNYSSWSLRPWVLMRQLAIPFQERLMPFSGADTHQNFRAFSPSGRVPCLVDGGVTVWDSLAIAEYLAERHAGVWPTDPAARAWARCAAAEMHSGFGPMRSHCGMNCGLRVTLREVPTSLQQDFARIDELWCEGLRRWGGPMLAGERFTAVDAFFAPVAFRVLTYAIPLSADALAYSHRLLELPAMRDWYAAALRETWRDPDHEIEVRQHGVIDQDLRSVRAASTGRQQ